MLEAIVLEAIVLEAIVLEAIPLEAILLEAILAVTGAGEVEVCIYSSHYLAHQLIIILNKIRTEKTTFLTLVVNLLAQP